MFAVGRNYKEVKYFLFNFEDRVFEEQIKRVARNGHGREDGKRREVVPSMSRMKSIMEFLQGKGAAERKTRWEMHRFSLISSSNSTKVKEKNITWPPSFYVDRNLTSLE